MTTWSSIYGTLSTAINLDSGSDLNSKADDTITELDGFLDNTTNRHRYAAFELYLGASGCNLSSGNTNPAVYLYAIPSFDGGTTYADSALFSDPAYAVPEIYMIGTFGFRAKTDATDSAAYRAVIEQVNLSPLKYKIVVKNDLGVAFPSSGVTLLAKTYTDTATDA